MWGSYQYHQPVSANMSSIPSLTLTIVRRLCGDLSIGWCGWMLTATFWLLALATKAAFDYYVLWKVWLGFAHIWSAP